MVKGGVWRTQVAVAHYRELLEVQIDEAVNSNAVCIPRPNAKVFLLAERFNGFFDCHFNRIFLTFGENLLAPEIYLILSERTPCVSLVRTRVRVVCGYNIINIYLFAFVLPRVRAYARERRRGCA